MRSIPWRIALVGMLVLPPAAGGQVERADAAPRRPWNTPDLQGIWLRQSSTPLERDAAVADRAVLTPVEAAAYLAERHAAINRYLALDLNADGCGSFASAVQRGPMGFCDQHGESYLTRRRRGEEGGGGGSVTGGTIPSA